MRLPAIALAVTLCLMIGSATLVAAAAPRSIGLIIDPGPATHAIPFMRFADALIETLSSSRQWEPTALHPDNPVVRVSGANWPQPANSEWAAAAEGLQALLVATQLDDLLVLKPIPSTANEVDILWLRQGEAPIRRLRLSQAGAGDQAYAALARQLLAQLEQGTAAAPVAERVAVKPAPAPVEPAPAAPASPAAPTAPATGAAVGVGGHETPAATAPAPPATTTPAAVDLAKPGTSSTQPGAPTTQPDLLAAQPGTQAVGPQTPAAPATAPAAPAETPPVTATPAAPEQPRPPSAFLPAAQKYLQEREFKKVEDMLLKAQEAGDARGRIYMMWSELEKARQNPTAERTWLQRALEADDSLTGAHLRLAELLRQAGLWRKAADEYQIVIKREPENLHAYLGLSALYASQSQPRRAAEILMEAVQHYPQDAALYLRLGDLHAQRQAWAEAENAYDRAARLTEGEPRADALDRLGDLYLSAGREREGFICYAEASKLRAGTPTGMAEKRYLQIMKAADEGLLKAIDRAHTALEAYLSGEGVYREEAWATLNDLKAQVAEVAGFVSGIVPPTSLKPTHLERKLAYSLAAEAALAGLDYVDQGKQQRLEEYSRLIDEAVETIRKLQRAG